MNCHRLSLLSLVLLAFLNPIYSQHVGIGTVTPGSLLEIQGMGTTSATSALNVTNSASTSLLFVRDDGNVGIGTITPGANLHLVGAFQYVDGNESADFVLRSDASGNASWVDPATLSDGWLITGNSGTTNGTNFLGTLDAQDLDFRTNNVLYTRISQKGQIEVFNTGQSIFIGDNAGEFDDLSTNRNVFVGHHAGRLNTSGQYNVAVGAYAHRFNTTGSENTATGYDALSANTLGVSNTAMGYRAASSNTTAGHNVAVGRDALYTQSYNNGGSTWNSYNVAVGVFALQNNQPTSTTNGNVNTAVGGYSLQDNTTGYGNAALGYASLRDNTTGIRNTAVGTYAAAFNTTGSWNTVVGRTTGYSNTTGIRNTFIGYAAGYTNTTGSRNTAVGNLALYSNTVSNLTAIGDSALFANTVGTSNTAIGSSALRNSTTGHFNTAVGQNSLYENIDGDYNTAIGVDALHENVGGDRNTSSGYFALSNNTDASGNTAMGVHAMRLQSFSNGGTAYNTYNTAVGYQALHNNQPTGVSGGSAVDAHNNTAVGTNALIGNTTGYFNVGLGRDAVQTNTTGSYNVGIGFDALELTNPGTANTAIGGLAGDSYNHGDQNSFLGYGADATAAGFSNATAIGAHAIVGGSNTVVIGSISGLNGASSNVDVGIGITTPARKLHIHDNTQTSTHIQITNSLTGTTSTDGLLLGHFGANGYIYNYEAGTLFIGSNGSGSDLVIDAAGDVGIGTPTPVYNLELANNSAGKPGGGSWTASSDARLKSGVEAFNDGLSQLLKIRPVKYRYNQLSGYDSSEVHVGVIAQELLEVAPYMVGTFERDGKTYYDVTNSAMTYMLINAVKELSQQNDRLRGEVGLLKQHLGIVSDDQCE